MIEVITLVYIWDFMEVIQYRGEYQNHYKYKIDHSQLLTLIIIN